MGQAHPNLLCILKTELNDTRLLINGRWQMAEQQEYDEPNQEEMQQSEQLAFLLKQLAQTSGAQGVADNAPELNHPNASKPAPVPPAQPRPISQSSHVPNTAEIDVKSITTYLASLRYIVEVLTRDRVFEDNILALIQDQEHQEKKWYQERQEIIRRQGVRDSGREQLANVLKIVGGRSEVVSLSSEDESAKQVSNKRELDAFDNRVYRMLVQLSKDTAARLAELRVPLFYIRPELVNENVLEDRKKVLAFLQDYCMGK